MATLQYKIITPEKTTEEGEALSLSVMTENGEITILPGHIELSTLLSPGEMRVKRKTGTSFLAVTGGFLQVLPDNKIVILAEEAYFDSELELAAIEEAKERARVALKNIKSKEEVSFADAAAHLERELVKYRVALKGKGRRYSSKQ